MSASHPFSLGLLVGRFQMPHLGHQYMIDTALSVCDRVGVLVGSSQESGTAANPFPFELRRDMLRELYGDRIEIAPLPDIGVGNNAVWGNYVLESALHAFGSVPDLAVSGAEGRRTSWFHSSGGDSSAGHTVSTGQDRSSDLAVSAGQDRCPDLSVSAGQDRSSGLTVSAGQAKEKQRFVGQPEPAELYLPKVIDISASELRGYLLENNFIAWSKFTDPRLHARFEELRALVLAGEAHTETASL